MGIKHGPESKLKGKSNVSLSRELGEGDTDKQTADRRPP